jgi:hypothetical protein
VKDNYFLEGKEQMVMSARLELVTMIAPYVGRYYSNEWVRENILKQSDEEIKEMDAEIAEEQNDLQYAGPLGMGMGDQQQMDDFNNPAVIADSGSFGSPSPELPDKPPKANGKANGSPQPVSKAGPNKKKGPNFRSVANILAKGT